MTLHGVGATFPAFCQISRARPPSVAPPPPHTHTFQQHGGRSLRPPQLYTAVIILGPHQHPPKFINQNYARGATLVQKGSGEQLRPQAHIAIRMALGVPVPDPIARFDVHGTFWHPSVAPVYRCAIAPKARVLLARKQPQKDKRPQKSFAS